MITVLLLAAALSPSAPVTMATVPAGTWRSPVEKDAPAVVVAAFLIDVEPVTNADYLRFVEEQPKWRRGAVPALFAEESYLSKWRGPLDVGDAGENAPVTSVSWFAARAYCAWRGARLPTTAEWERAASGATVADLLAWYGKPVPARLPAVGGAPNQLGVRDINALIWEWVEDFSSSMLSSDARAQNDADALRFCGGGATNAADASDYAAFMRFAFRGSLEGNHALAALGFRCARSAP